MQGMKDDPGPKVAKLQEKYKDDKQKLNDRIDEAYIKEHKVNPVGGCLPMFLQMPVFIALFNILYMTIDLRQAPFMLVDSRPVHTGSRFMCCPCSWACLHVRATKNYAHDRGS